MTALPSALFQAAVAASGDAIVITGAAADDHPIVYANAAFVRMTGYPLDELVGCNARMLQGDRTDSAILDSVRTALDLDEGFEGETVNYRKDGQPYRVSWLISPVRDDGGSVSHWVSVQRDVTALRMQEGQLRLLVRELHHRVKNTLATVQALVNATIRTSPSMDAFSATFAGRLTSLARTHTLLFDGHATSTTMRDILRAELSPYDEKNLDRVGFEGSDVPLTGDLAVGLGMAIHELTTNAVKYGALSVPGGRIAVTWALDEDGDLDWSWIESGGPPVSPPATTGFGSRLLRRVLIDQLQARVEQRFAPTGLQVHVKIPRSLAHAVDEIGLPIHPTTDPGSFP